MINNNNINEIDLKKKYAILNFFTTRISLPIFIECKIYFANLALEERFLKSFRLILIDMLHTTSQKYKLNNIFLFNFTAYSMYCLQKPTKKYKSYGQAPNETLFPRILWSRDVSLTA